MAFSLDADVETSRVGFALRPVFAGNPSASTTSAWTSGPTAKYHAALAPSSLQASTTSSIFGAPNSDSRVSTPTSNVKQLSGEALDAATSTDLAAFLQDVEVLRIFVEVEELPFALLEQIHAHPRATISFFEMHVCIQLSLRPALQEVLSNIGPKRAMSAAMRKWAVSKFPLKFFFPLPHIGPEVSYQSESYQEVALRTAVTGLDASTVELADNLWKAEGGPSITEGMPHNALPDLVGYRDAMDVDSLL